MARHLLSALKVKNAKPGDKPFRLSDGEGLYLYVPPSGVLSWQFRYRWHGKASTATLGKLANRTLAEAREAAQAARDALARGDNPLIVKRVDRAKRHADAQNTFKAVAADWIKSESRRAQWSPDYRIEVKSSIENHLHELDGLPLAEIRANIAAPIIRKIERKAPHMVEKVTRRLRVILDYGVEQGVIDVNPLPQTRRRRKVERRHYPALLKRDDIGALLRAADKTDACRGVKRAHVLTAFCAQRIAEVVGAKWHEFDLDTALWSIPRDRMKRKDLERGPHQIPLAPRLVAMLRDWQHADGDDAIYVCPAPRNDEKPITVEAPEKFYRTALDLAGKHSPHSWRSVFSTWAHDAGKDSDAIEAHLDHVTGNLTKTSYDRAKRLDLRRELMRWYENELMVARDGATVVKLKDRA